MSESTSVPAVELAIRSDPGRDPDKQVNEDAAAQAETRLGLLAVVCDGMGGHAGGKEAAELAVKTIVEIVSAAPAVASPREALRVAIEEANRRVWSMPTAESGLRPGSTVVAVLLSERGAEIAHVGDSRIYLVHAGAIAQITRDHSMVQEMVDRNLLRADEAAGHPDANKILRALGIAKDVEVELRPEPIAYVAGDVFVLCSDGLSDLVGPADILRIAGSQPPAQAAGQLVDLANAHGGHDNVTALVLRLKSTARAGEAPTIVKTVQVTQHLPASEQAPAEAKDAGQGPRGTLMATPLAAPSSSSSSAQVPAPAPSRPSDESPASDRRHVRVPVSLLVALLGAAVLAAVVIVVWTLRKPKHVAVPIVEPDAGLVANPTVTATATATATTTATATATATGTALTEADASPPEVTASPPLTPPPGATTPPWWKDPDAEAPSGEPRECVMARWQRAHGRPLQQIEALERKCRERRGEL